MPKPNFSIRHAPSGGEPEYKRPKPGKKLSKEEKETEKGKEKQNMAKYTIKGKEVWRPYSATGYSDVHGGGIPTQISPVAKTRKNAERAAKVQRAKATAKVRTQTVSRLSKHPDQRYKNSTRPIL